MTLRLAPLMGAAIAGVGTALPHEVDEAVAPLGADDAWRAVFGDGWREELAARGWNAEHVERRYGVAVRHAWPRGAGTAATSGSRGALTTPAERATALALRAARAALGDAEQDGARLDGVVVGTATATRVSASTAAALATALDSDAATLDVRAGGASGLAAWVQGAQWIAGGARAVLVVALDVVPEFLRDDDVVHRMLFSCGAAAFVLRATDDDARGLESSVIGREPASGRAFTIATSLAVAPAAPLCFEGPDADYARSLDDAWARAVDEFTGLDPAPDRFAPYAVTRDQVRRAADRAGMPADDALTHLRDHGCLGNASALFQVAHGLRSGAWRRGDRVAAVAVGGGICRHSLVWRV